MYVRTESLSKLQNCGLGPVSVFANLPCSKTRSDPVPGPASHLQRDVSPFGARAGFGVRDGTPSGMCMDMCMEMSLSLNAPPAPRAREEMMVRHLAWSRSVASCTGAHDDAVAHVAAHRDSVHM